MLKKILLIGIPILLLIGILGFVVWGSTPLPASPEALGALQSPPQVTVGTVQDWTVFRPTANPTRTGFIFYPGGRVDYRAYAPILRAVAEQGYLVVLVPMPLNLAVFGVERAQTVLSAFPEIKHWAIGGHSLGGSMAAQFGSNHPGLVAGLVFWASYCQLTHENAPPLFSQNAPGIYGQSAPPWERMQRQNDWNFKVG
jgi:hypothetical protein